MPPSQTNQPFQQYQGPPNMPPSQMAPINSANSAKSHSLGLILALVLFVLLFFGAAGFGLWAYGQQQNYKNNTDKITAKAVDTAIKNEDAKKDIEAAEKEKNPLKTYLGPAAYGSLSISYPKTWGAYVVEDNGATAVEGYFHPGFVPNITGKTAFALHVQVTSQAYDQEMKQFEGKIKSGTLKVTPFVSKNVPGVTGARVEGAINPGQKDVMILLPLRDKTIKIATESDQFVGDFDSIILANLKFIP